jgi:ribosome-associated protein
MRKKFPAETASETEEKSRSQKKRESWALQDHGRFLAGISPALWKKLPLSPELGEALQAWRSMKTFEAKRRHMHYIGRLMRELNEDEQSALLAALDGLRHDNRLYPPGLA